MNEFILSSENCVSSKLNVLAYFCVICREHLQVTALPSFQSLSGREINFYCFKNFSCFLFLKSQFYLKQKTEEFIVIRGCNSFFFTWLPETNGKFNSNETAIGHSQNHTNLCPLHLLVNRVTSVEGQVKQ